MAEIAAVGAGLFAANKQRQGAKAGKREQKRIQLAQDQQDKIEKQRLAEETSEVERRRIIALRGRQGRRSLITTSERGLPNNTLATNLGGGTATNA